MSDRPSPRPFIVGLIFALAGSELAAMIWAPHAAASEAFKQIATMTFTGGPITIANFYFGSSHKDPPA